ncbi:hypothetical protein GGS20DRAFT_274250 [Poronia punctata]|nr:hypothetical protein GGS20DRAFT_274250 [Poronia punctata]
MLLADLRNNGQGPIHLSFIDFEQHTEESGSKIAGFYIRHDRATTEDLGHTSCAVRKSYIKALIKGHKMAVQATKLLLGSVVDDNGLSTKMMITDTAIVGGPPSDGHSKQLEGITSFQKTQFQFPNFVSSQYLHFSRETAPLHDVLVRKGQAMYDRVYLQSGICLFSMDMVQSSLDTDGRIDTALLSWSKPTFYEVEYIARACPVIADLGAMIHGALMNARGQNPNLEAIPICIGLDVPSFHYFHSVQSKLQGGQCTFPEALRWMQTVLQRHEQVSDVFQGYLNHQLAKRGVKVSEMNVIVSRRGISVAAHILEALKRAEMPTFDGLLKRLSEADDVWDDFWNMLPPKERPADFRDLNYLFYVYEVLRPALVGNLSRADESRPKSKTTTGRLILSIDDAAERRIYSRAQKLLKKLRNNALVERSPSLIEIYMSRRVFIDSNQGGSNMYLADPSPKKAVVVPWKPSGEEEEDDLQHRFTGELGPYDLVRNLHGEEASTVIRGLFENVGL